MLYRSLKKVEIDLIMVFWQINYLNHFIELEKKRKMLKQLREDYATLETNYEDLENTLNIKKTTISDLQGTY